MVSVHRTETFAGPLPHPGLLRQYDEVFPGCAERIVAMAEKQSAHRQSLETQHLTGNQSAERLGQILAAIIAVVGLLIAGFLSWQGQAVMGFSLFVLDLAVLVGVFVYGRKTTERERETRRKELEKKMGARAEAEEQQEKSEPEAD